MPKNTTPAPDEAVPSSRRLVAMPLGELVAAARNPKGHDLPGLNRAIAKFGYVEAITLDERTGRLVAGHGRVEALRTAKARGDAAPEGIDVRPTDGEWLVPTQRGWSSRSDDEAEAYLVASNHLTTKGGWDDHGLAEMLSDLHEVHLLELTGYSEEDLAALEKLLTGPAPGAGDLLDPPEDDRYRSQFGVIVECTDAAEQEQVYERLRGQGYSCRVVTV